MKHHFPPEPISLIGNHVELHPLKMEHCETLTKAVLDGELWKLWFTLVPSPEAMKQWIEKALTEEKEKSSLPFVVQSKVDGKIIGSTRYMNIEKTDKRLEIGSTWYSKEYQKTFVNTECKFLLLEYAFENLDCIAVEFRTHRLNQNSRKAIERLGATLDGILRNHRTMPNGTLRDTAVYSIISSEWPTTRSHLKFKLERKSR
ncbi:acetyltransferase (GNAT) domain protein [Leptospira kirschneri str. 200803703]|uniref:GNAT family N-acetyltransferase n=1 Tax=Leptospira kirschneri TaxID=29507 RepID=UPI000289A88E|nr:GNAT family protein [Leptospira kirschneri]EKP06736.1 acetyltransferase (GNAT) domain protein [Leptospira kirschneri str. 2008720114]EMK18773.1 acetyltransferase (GNAT) domain protein [Leptospira kirschneri serovar Bim str. PUO 1247]EMN03567.1 acetyltransferase (GNAT) domain protein [Leptospira kirschneri serovar Bim str. 1051]EMO67696.1 acetyltransferase (GNAT) domain protein [Leptospira kirschneri str. 200803703]EMO81747.1 acetyltransferase (GNAT) domain protein [Leptospira kirschneri str